MTASIISITIFIVIAAYLIGSISSAVVVSRLMGFPDPRTDGSRNPGATNVLRLGGKKAAIITLLSDVLKGLAPVLAARLYLDSPPIIAVVALAAFGGHVFPVLFRFQGGKGVATALGAIAAITWPTALAAFGTWLLVALISRYSSLSALIAALLTPIYTGIFTANLIYTGAIGLIALLIIWRHRTNIRNLIKGTETKIGQKVKG
uniref:Glycerol-3-phosphate acyltransferase n=1 Tax=Candidatus Kentrum sp. MB TaxID=2138164 RepID=A0A450XDY7_9GAMM|nr:MAG: acyl-phosphate glycerol-3-phosphate acyltransferase [Candidatus Kentron sp. MB]VFK28607.1 MAG: acyl-phosphate glycerol-3-phosphate acyltransferase [Candidatus Kentron sp. MB]VFK74324.1 MAG: acyl-phosphate glycerol-3-phosphate acyltransferase [Candidatus Kentron sp. MB]